MKLWASFFAMLLFSSELFAQSAVKIGYVYPAGGTAGTTFQVILGGRRIPRCNEITISGEGVQGRIIKGYGSSRIDDGEHRKFIYDLYKESLKKLEGPSTTTPASPNPTPNRDAKPNQKPEQKPNPESNQKTAPKATPSATTQKTDEPPKEEEITFKKMADRYPFVDGLEKPTTADLERVFDRYFSPKAVRDTAEALGQMVLAEITIDAQAKPGNRDLRIRGPEGLSLPVRFVVGTVPEILEREPNDTAIIPGKPLEIWNRRVDDAPQSVLKQDVYSIPIVLNGQIIAGDVDRFQFKARRGQRLVIHTHARHLIPYIADAVPGWFQPVVSLYDPAGKKVDEAMSWRHDIDPILLVETISAGNYTLEVQDSLFRGRGDFVYRITVAESPFVTSHFPLGGRRGEPMEIGMEGWNLTEKTLTLNGKDFGTGIHEISSVGASHLLRPIRIAVDDLPEMLEKEPNNTLQQAEKLKRPVIVNGQIMDESDVDYFSFEGRKGDSLVLDVASRSLDLPLDAAVKLFDANGTLIASNDDRADSKGPNIGDETHHADPYLLVELPSDGLYSVLVYSVSQRGGKEYGYRLRISPPRPDFSVYCEPSSITFSRPVQPLKIHLVRKEGFSGDVTLRLSSADARKFQLQKAVIPSGTDKATVDFAVMPQFELRMQEVRLEAVARVDGRELVRPVLAVEDMEQAFIYHHLVPAQSLMVDHPGNRRNPPAQR